MSKILVGEFRELKDIIDGSTKQVIGELEVDIKTYLPIKEKMELGQKIFVETMDIDEGFLIFDDTVRELATKCFVVDYYTNITLPKDKFEAYDIIKSSKLDEVVEKSMGDKEMLEVNAIVDNYIAMESEKYEQEHNISNVIKNAISGLGSSLDGIDLESLKNEVTKQGRLN